MRQQFESCGDERDSSYSKSLIAVSIICLVASFLAAAAYFGWRLYLKLEREKLKTVQLSFLSKLEKDISSSADKPELLIQNVFLEYKEFFEKQENITGVSLKDILAKRFDMNLPVSRKTLAEIRRDIYENLIPEKFPVRMKEYKLQKQVEAVKIYRLAKIGDTVTVRSSRQGNYTGVFNGFGSKGASVQIDSRYFALYDLPRENKAQFDPLLNELVRAEYVVRHCNRYREAMHTFSESALHKEMRKRGYLYRGEFFSPSEYLAALEQDRPFKMPKARPARKHLARAKESELKKLSPSCGESRLSRPAYYRAAPKSRPVRTLR